ncbi:MAG: hypothetical protein ACKVS9_09775 [Phycisphaerae bacterium]
MRIVHRLTVALCIGLVALRAPAEIKPAAAYMPENCVVFASLVDGDKRLSEFQTWFDATGVLESALGQEVTSSPEFMQARVVLAGLAATAGVDPWGAVAAPLGREFAIGLSPREGKGPRVILVAIPRDAALVDRMLEMVHGFAGIRTDKQNGKAAGDKTRTIDGVTIFELNREALQCRVGDAVLLSNDADLLTAAIKAAGGGANLFAKKSFAESLKQRPGDAIAHAWVDVAALRKLMPPERFDAKQSNPLAAFLFGGWWHSIRHSECATGWITPIKGGIAADVRVRSDEKLPESHRGLIAKGDRPDAWSSVELPRYMAEICVDRDWAALLAEREALLTPAGASDAANFITTLSNLFGGMDVVGEVVSRIAGPVRLIVADQEFAAGVTLPSPQLPAFALAIPIDGSDLAKLTQRLYSMSTMSASIINFVLAQNGQPAFLVDVDRYRDQKVVFATYAEEPGTDSMKMNTGGEDVKPVASRPAGTKAHLRHNFAPAAAVVEGYYIISSTRPLLHDLIDRMIEAKGKPPRAKGSDQDRVAIDLKALTAILRKNADELVTNRMLEEDAPKAKAKRDIDVLFLLLDLFEKASIASGRDDGGYRARLDIVMRK